MTDSSTHIHPQEPSFRTHLRHGDAWAGLWKATEGIRARRVWSAMGTTNIPHTSLLHFCSFFPLPDVPSPAILTPWDPTHQPTKPSYWTSSMNVPLISSPCTWLIPLWSGLVLGMQLIVTHFHPYKYAHTCMHMNRHTFQASRMPHTQGADTS